MDMRQQAYGPHTRPDEHGSRTLTIQNTEADGAATSSRDVGVLHLRAPQRSDLENSSADRSGSARRVMWTDDTVDNEGLGRKKSKICCIYHKPKAYDESSSESSSCESSDDSDVPESSEEEDRARPSRGKQSGSGSNQSCPSIDASHRCARKRNNAYERG